MRTWSSKALAVVIATIDEEVSNSSSYCIHWDTYQHIERTSFGTNQIKDEGEALCFDTIGGESLDCIPHEDGGGQASTRGMK